MDIKAKIIIDLVCSLNKGNSGYIDERVRYAIEQYNKLVKAGIIEEDDNTDELPEQGE
jgi:hypothetical protein